MCNDGVNLQRDPSKGRLSPMIRTLPKGYLCSHAPEPVEIDGRLDKRAWRDAAWTEDFVDIEGDAKPRPWFSTRAKMLWDDSFFISAPRWRRRTSGRP